MAEARIPVDLFNPGQVFACLGFLEAVDMLLGDACGGFDWSNESDVRFVIKSPGAECPVRKVLDFLTNVSVQEIEPVGWPDLRTTGLERSESFPSPLADHRDNTGEMKRTKLPIGLVDVREKSRGMQLQHWTDGSSRPDFKLYAGNRSGYSIALDMLKGKKSKPNKKHPSGTALTFGIRQLWQNRASELATSPFNILIDMGGSFNLDARGAWTSLDAGYSPDEQGHRLGASPVVEFLAALGLENSRPLECERGTFRYSVWETPVTLELARPLIAGCPIAIPLRVFEFKIRLSGKNKIVSFSQEALPDEPLNNNP